MKIAEAERRIAAYMKSRRRRDLYLYGCTGLTALPDGLTVGGWLSLDGCTGLTALPDGLTVGGLSLDGCTGLTRLCVGQDSRGYAFYGVAIRHGRRRVVRVVAGCRCFTPAKARAHWSKRPEQLALAEAAIALAARKAVKL